MLLFRGIPGFSGYKSVNNSVKRACRGWKQKSSKEQVYESAAPKLGPICSRIPYDTALSENLLARVSHPMQWLVGRSGQAYPGSLPSPFRQVSIVNSESSSVSMAMLLNRYICACKVIMELQKPWLQTTSCSPTLRIKLLLKIPLFLTSLQSWN